MQNLKEFQCPKCGKKLIWAYESSEVQCNGCYRWIKFKDIKLPNPCKMSINPNEEQLKLF